MRFGLRALVYRTSFLPKSALRVVEKSPQHFGFFASGAAMLNIKT
jgi:hypothetical protein